MKWFWGVLAQVRLADLHWISKPAKVAKFCHQVTQTQKNEKKEKAIF